ncbi:MAG TPA: hypothetical protein VFE55_20705 [Acidimicrobiia bacterium]|nr:hypothetical protein [Acidimicrobiia bacterium]
MVSEPWCRRAAGAPAHLYVGGNFTKVAATPGGTYRSQPGLAVYDAAS